MQFSYVSENSQLPSETFLAMVVFLHELPNIVCSFALRKNFKLVHFFKLCYNRGKWCGIQGLVQVLKYLSIIFMEFLIVDELQLPLNQCCNIQLWTYAYIRLLNRPYGNEVTLRRQKPPLKCCQLLDFQSTFLKGLDILMIKIWGLQIKGLQSYQLSKLEVSRKSLPQGPGHIRTNQPAFENARGQIILKV